jgi:hypothetical protein
MLALKQALSLVSTKKTGTVIPWSPSDEGSNLVAWYKNKVGISLVGSEVTSWEDSSASANHSMEQATSEERPLYNAATGSLTFDSSNSSNLQTLTQMSFSGKFTVAFKMNATGTNNTIIGDNTSSNEYFKITSATNLRVKTDAQLGNLTVVDYTLTDVYVVVTRDASNLVRFTVNGVPQVSSATVTGTSDIDAIGIRAVDNNSFDGEIFEVQIYNTENATLTSNINTYLANI